MIYRAKHFDQVWAMNAMKFVNSLCRVPSKNPSSEYGSIRYEKELEHSEHLTNCKLCASLSNSMKKFERCHDNEQGEKTHRSPEDLFAVEGSVKAGGRPISSKSFGCMPFKC